jgi:hypothetical protein
MAIVGIIPLAVGYGITLLFRSATIIVLIATLPITAAGLVSMATKHWFWRASRWLLALIFLKPTFALCFAIGAGVVKAAGQPPQNGAHGGTGAVTLLLGLGIMFIALFAPYALFRLFAFVEPGTQPHQTMMSAFGSAMGGFTQAGSAIASADVGSVFSGATSGRFGASSGSNEGQGSSSGSSSDSDGAKKAAVAAGLAAATGGSSLAATGAAGGSAAAGEGAAAAGGSSSGAAGVIKPVAASATGGQADDSETGQPQDEQQGAGELAGAGAAAASANASAAGAASSGGRSLGSGGSAGGTANGSAPSGSLAGYWQAARGSASTSDHPGLSAAGSAVGSVGGGAWATGQQIAGRTRMPPAPMGGVTGNVGGGGASDYDGGTPAVAAPNAYRDPSWNRGDYADFRSPPPDDRYGDQDDEDDGDEHRMSGVI